MLTIFLILLFLSCQCICGKAETERLQFDFFYASIIIGSHCLFWINRIVKANCQVTQLSIANCQVTQLSYVRKFRGAMTRDICFQQCVVGSSIGNRSLPKKWRVRLLTYAVSVNILGEYVLLTCLDLFAIYLAYHLNSHVLSNTWKVGFLFHFWFSASLLFSLKNL